MSRSFWKFWDDFKEYIVLVLLLVLSLIIFSSNKNAKIQKVRSYAFVSFSFINSAISDVISYTQLKYENDRLRYQNSQLMMQVNRLREYGIVNEELKKLIGFKDSVNYPLITSKIIAKSNSNSQTIFTIDVGTNKGVRCGMPVITDVGLLGIVTAVASDYSIVKTLKDREVKLTVKNQRSRCDALMKWNGEDIIIYNIPKTNDFEVGDRIITSELSSIVPIPIPVGVVKEISKVETGIFKEMKIKPYVDFDRVSHVFVLGIVNSEIKNNFELNFYNRN
jgi:rod shape-determining protein MreC